MSLDTYTGTYTDCGLDALAAYSPTLKFTLERESFGTDGRLLSRRPVEASFVDGAGTFAVSLVPSDEIQGGTKYKIVAEYLDAAGNFTSLDLFSFYARAGGGRVADMTGAAPSGALVFWQAAEPDPWPAGWIWVNSVTGDVQRKVA